MRYSTILFDFDGTLADSASMIAEILEELALQRGIKDFSFDDFRDRKSLSVRKKLRMLLFFARVQKEFKEIYGDRVSRIAFFEGMQPMLLQLHQQGCQLVILSSNNSDNIHRFLRMHGVSLPLPVLPPNGVLGKHKTIRRYLRDNGCAPAEVLYVGDEARDVRACNRCGVDIAFVSWGLDKTIDTSLKVRFTASTPWALARWLMEQ